MIPSLPHDVVFGYATAGAGTLAIWVADAADQMIPGIAPFLQTGGTAALICGLVVAVKSLWSENRYQRQEIRKLNEEIRSEWKSQSEELISVLKKLDKDQ